MDVDVDSLTDTELRSKLTEFGYPVMPITGTTRKLMQKKLRLLLENKGKSGKEGRRSLGRFSSEEESDSDSKTTNKREKRRATMAAPTMQPPRRAPKEEKMVTTTTRTTKIVQSARDEYETGSESDEVAEKYESEVRESPGLRGSPGRLPSSFISATKAAEAASDRLSQIRSRHSSYGSSFYNQSGDDLLKDKENTPFLSNFTKRLSQLSESPKNNVFEYKSDVIKENDVNGGTSTRALLNSFRSGRGRLNSYDYKLTNQSIFKNNFVPFIVLVLAVLFFLIVAMLYLGIRQDTSMEVTVTTPICVKTDVTTRKHVNCIIESEKKPTLNLLQVLKPELDRRAYRNKCEDDKAKPYMTEDDIVTFISKNFRIQNETRILADLSNLQILSFFNSMWGINVIQMDEDGVNYSETAIAKDMDQVLENKAKKVTALISRNPYIPWKCYIYNTFSTFLRLLLSLTIGIALVFAVNHIYKAYRQIKQKQHEEEMTIVENIIDILQTNAVEQEVNYMVINHVRDMILPINQRKSKQKAWSRAVKYIYENESRIRTEEQEVQGEITEIWRWLGGTNLNGSKSKSWQGQAFETQVGSVNSLPCSPTPCLKIRGMVEEGDRNTVAIRKAVLSKCAQQCKILHCAVDLNSKCVYLKCVDQNDAAVAYRNLHGWWYAGNLVTVKYLRLERYMQRFPESPVSGPYLN